MSRRRKASALPSRVAPVSACVSAGTLSMPTPLPGNGVTLMTLTRIGRVIGELVEEWSGLAAGGAADQRCPGRRHLRWRRWAGQHDRNRHKPAHSSDAGHRSP